MTSFLVKAQNYIRDSGTGRFLSDTLTMTAGGAGMLWHNSKLLFHFLAPNKKWTINAKYGENKRHTLDVYPCEGEEGKKAPVIAFVHGGGWGSGKPLMYRLLGVRLAKEGFHCVVIGYRTYPCADINGQMDDVEAALHHIKTNLGVEGGPLARIGKGSPLFLAGHSSGAHVCTHLILERYKNLRFLEGVIGLAGVYHIGDHYILESKRGHGELSPMKAANGGPKQFDVHSPIILAERIKKEYNLPKMLLVHGTKDEVAEHSNSTRLGNAIGDRFSCKVELLEGVNHGGIVTEMFFLEKEVPWIGILQEFCLIVRTDTKNLELAKEVGSPTIRGNVQTGNQAEAKEDGSPTIHGNVLTGNQTEEIVSAGSVVSASSS